MAKALWPGKDPLGQCVKLGNDTTPCTYVVGVAENIKARSLTRTRDVLLSLRCAIQSGVGQRALRMHERRPRRKKQPGGGCSR